MIQDGELKTCEVCGREYQSRDLERIFTGRTQLICYKCMRSGKHDVAIRMNIRNSKRDKVRMK